MNLSPESSSDERRTLDKKRTEGSTKPHTPHSKPTKLMARRLLGSWSLHAPAANRDVDGLSGFWCLGVQGIQDGTRTTFSPAHLGLQRLSNVLVLSPLSPWTERHDLAERMRSRGQEAKTSDDKRASVWPSIQGQERSFSAPSWVAF